MRTFHQTNHQLVLHFSVNMDAKDGERELASQIRLAVAASSDVDELDIIILMKDFHMIGNHLKIKCLDHHLLYADYNATNKF